MNDVIDWENLELFELDAQRAAAGMSADVVFNLTQHKATADQVNVVEPPDKAAIQGLLTFDEVPSRMEMEHRAWLLAMWLEEWRVEKRTRVMIGGAPFFMSTLERVLLEADYRPVYAFSIRDSVDAPDGTKTSVFRHVGFVEM